LCRNIHSQKSYRETANEIFCETSLFINELNADVQIYQKFKEIRNNEKIFQSLKEEERIFCDDMLAEYENEGIHVTEPKRRQEIVKLQVLLLPL
jgi:Zn-dependent oligopeptidase